MIYTEIVGMETQVTHRSNPTVNAQGSYMVVIHLSVFGTSLGRCFFLYVKGGTKSILGAEYLTDIQLGIQVVWPCVEYNQLLLS